MRHFGVRGGGGVTLVHCPFDWPDMTQKEHVAAIFLWSCREFSVTSNSNRIAIPTLEPCFFGLLVIGKRDHQ
jgi:hypothetical protein